ncbi:MAG: glycosyltransferase family 2 protein [Acidobacteria bacterium]|nr:MAG: glycosyltransferase family 2 protein [Acidobacteriota bacterium]
MSTPLALSIIIPAYNEATRIERSLAQVFAYLSARVGPSEVIVVDDGSTDETVEIVRQFGRTHPSSFVRLVVLRNGQNRGKGYSVKQGVLHARGEVVAFTDADLSAPITELPKLTEPIARGECDIAIGSRAVDRRLIGKRQPIWRDYAGRLFNFLMRMITGLRFKDTQCGFKAYRRESVLPIFQEQRIHGFAFDVEILFLATKRGLRIAEVPVIWNHAPGSRVHMVRDSVRMFVELLKIRWYDWRHRYSDVGALAARAPH